MNSAIERLLSLRASDVMSRNVICVSPSHTVEQAASLFTEHEISGAPVVDDNGQCVRVLSSTDFMCRAEPKEACQPAGVVDTVLVAGQGRVISMCRSYAGGWHTNCFS